MRSSDSLTGLFAGTLLVQSAAAICTNWTSTSWSYDSDLSTSENEIPLTYVSCPSSNKTDCLFPDTTYHLTIPRKLNISVDPSELDSVFTLASSGYGPEAANFTPPAFIERTVNPSLASLTATQRKTYEVDPGQNYTLYWRPYFVYSEGMLSGCSNESLEGVYVEATASAPENYSASVSNMSDADGTFLGSIKPNGAEKIRAGGSLWLMAGSVAAMSVAFMM